MPKVSGYKFVKVGRSTKEMFDSPVQKTSEEHIMYPSLHLDNQEVEGLEKFGVGDQVQLVIKGVITHKSISERKGGKKNCSQTIDIHTIGVPASKGSMDSDGDYDDSPTSEKMARKKMHEKMAS